MHSFVVLALVSSVLSLPVLTDIPSVVPAGVTAPAGAVVGAVENVAAPVQDAIAKVGLGGLTGVADSGNTLTARQSSNVTLPPLPEVLGSAQANATKIAGNIQGLLAGTPVAGDLLGPLTDLNAVVSGVTNQLAVLNGLPVASVLQAKDGEVEASTQQVAQTLNGLTRTVSGVVQQVTEQLGDSIPELKPVFSLLNGSLGGIVSTVTGLLPDVTKEVLPLLTPLSATLNSLGLGVGLSAAGV